MKGMRIRGNEESFMQLTGLLDLLREHPTYRAVFQRVRDAKAGGALAVVRAARPYVLAALSRDWPGPVLYVTRRVDRAYNVSEQLPAWLGPAANIARFAEPTPLFYERAPWR